MSCRVFSFWNNWFTFIRWWGYRFWTFIIRDNLLDRDDKLLLNQIFQGEICIFKTPNSLFLSILLLNFFNFRLFMKLFLITIRENSFWIFSRTMKGFVIKYKTIFINYWFCMSEGSLMYQSRIVYFMMIERLVWVYTC